MTAPIIDSPGLTQEINNPVHSHLVVRHAFQDRLVWKLRDARWDSRSGLVSVGGHPVVESLSDQRAVRPVFFSASQPRVISDQTWVAIARRPWNFYHWLLEDLPVLLRARRHLPQVRVAVGKNPPHYVIDSLRLLEFSFEVMKRDAIFSHYLLPSRGDDAGWHHPHDVQLLREAFLGNSGRADWGPAIYVSRRFSTRALRDEAQVEKELKKRGFEVVFPERLPFQDQVRVFSQAPIVVGNHGAGLSTTVFGPENMCVIELASSSYPNPCFEALCVTRGVPYQRVLTRPHKKYLDDSSLGEEGLERLLELVDDLPPIQQERPL